MISSHAVLTAMTNTVGEYGDDYVYPRINEACLYFNGGEPSCLIGHVIARVTPDFKPDEGTVAMHRHQFAGAGYSDRAILVMSIAQRVQDGGHTWGAALGAAYAVADYATEYSDGT